MEIEESQEDPVIAEARKDGWVSKEEYRGDPDKWSDAPEFVERGKHINRILQSKLKRQEDQISELRAGVEEFKKFSNAQVTHERAKLETALQELKTQKAVAIREGDGELVTDLDDRIDHAKTQLKETKPSEQPQEQRSAQDKADFEDWNQSNNWYGKDRKATRFADMVAQDILKRPNPPRGKVFLSEVDSILREEYPEIYANPARSRPGAVEGHRTTGGTESMAAFKQSLPAADRQLMEKGVEEGWFTSEEEFRTQYKELK